MEPLAPISFASAGGSRAAGWQQQVRVDFVVNKVMQTHRGQPQQAVTQAIQDQLRMFGVVPNNRQIAQYAAAIAALPQLHPPPTSHSRSRGPVRQPLRTGPRCVHPARRTSADSLAGGRLWWRG